MTLLQSQLPSDLGELELLALLPDHSEPAELLGSGEECTVVERRTFVANQVRIQLVCRVLSSEGKDPEEQLTIHRYLQEHGIPTMDSFFIDGDGYPVTYSSDLTEGGAAYCFSVNNPGPYDKSEILAEGISNPREVEEQLEWIYAKSVELNLELGHHSCFFIVINKETRHARIVIGDFGAIRLPDPKDSDQEQRVIQYNHNDINELIEFMNLYLPDEQRLSEIDRHPLPGEAEIDPVMAAVLQDLAAR